MSLADSLLAAFATASGISADKLSLFVRTLLLVMTFLWAAWCVYGELNHFSHHGVEVDVPIRRTTRILFLVGLMVMLVFISH